MQLIQLVHKAAENFPDEKREIKRLALLQKEPPYHGQEHYERLLEIRRLSKELFYRSLSEGYITNDEAETLLSFYQLH
jgi:hypothetical protein